ncbi:hypothetical protein L9F63_002188, partial [Diploptera punctata]
NLNTRLKRYSFSQLARLFRLTPNLPFLPTSGVMCSLLIRKFEEKAFFESHLKTIALCYKRAWVEETVNIKIIYLAEVCDVKNTELMCHTLDFYAGEGWRDK